jgi:CO/xanthine dehydrogenase Mo-binding subunit
VALLRLLADGSAVLLAGTTEVGQGARTILCQIVAQELSIPVAKVTMRETETRTTPFDRSTGASRSTTVMGSAVKAAALDLRRQLIEAAVEILRVNASTITLSNGQAVSGDKQMTYGQVVSAFFGTLGKSLPLFWETGMGSAEIAVDEETGAIRVEKYVTVADVGKALNPLQAEGQDEGAAIQGLGNTLFEALEYENGQPLNASLVDYRVPRFTDLPALFTSALVENSDGPGPYGAKGMGESGIVSVAPAIGNALFNATGVRIRDLPLTPERVWRALRDRGDGQR